MLHNNTREITARGMVAMRNVHNREHITTNSAYFWLQTIVRITTLGSIETFVRSSAAYTKQPNGVQQSSEEVDLGAYQLRGVLLEKARDLRCGAMREFLSCTKSQPL